MLINWNDVIADGESRYNVSDIVAKISSFSTILVAIIARSLGISFTVFHQVLTKLTWSIIWYFDRTRFKIDFSEFHLIGSKSSCFVSNNVVETAHFFDMRRLPWNRTIDGRILSYLVTVVHLDQIITNSQTEWDETQIDHQVSEKVDVISVMVAVKNC